MATVQRWGNSLAVRIPARLAKKLQIEAGSTVQLRCEPGTVVVQPKRRPKYRLADLLRGVKPSQLHGENEF